ncbi:MAG: hypothetical protein J0H41_15490 [Rhizobiales bacterium]|nr:hypothetical protein [Hyphomicrobiales bacterium]
MDGVKPAPSAPYAKAMALSDALLSAFAREGKRPSDRPDEKVLFSAPFQMLIAAQKNIDETRSQEPRAPLQDGVGEEIDTRA